MPSESADIVTEERERMERERAGTPASVYPRLVREAIDRLVGAGVDRDRARGAVRGYVRSRREPAHELEGLVLMLRIADRHGRLAEHVRETFPDA